MPHSKPCPDPFSPESLANLPEARVLLSTVEYVTEYMSRYDGSHDLSHLKRVVSLARRLHFDVPDTTTPPRDPVVVVLAALLHDIGDKKYLKPSDDPNTMVLDFLLSQNVDPATASKVQAICLAVSYSSEVANPTYVQDMLKCYPELAVVQDADRLDAIGAVGIGRCFMFGGAKGRLLQDSVDHFEEKLIKLENMMKTKMGKEMARERTRRLREFVGWWEEETRTS